MPRKKPADRLRGQIVARGTNRYLVRVYLGREPSGKRRYSSKTVSGTFSVAQRELTRMLGQVDCGTYVQPSKQTVEEYLTHWIATAKPNLAERTRVGYQTGLRKHVYPALGCRRLDKLTAQDIQGLYAQMLATGISARTVRYYHMVLKQALKRAVQWGFLARNPAEFIDLPRQQRREMKTLTPEQAAQLLAVSKDDELGVLWGLLIYTGMRPSEALALKWTDLADRTRITIQRSLTRQANDSLAFKDPKTAKGRRTVTIPESLAVWLHEHRSRQAAQILRAGGKYQRNDLIFANQVGGPLQLKAVRAHWKRAVKQAGLSVFRLYDARHTHASLLLASGANPKVVSERLGHSSITLTLDTYTHVLPELDAEVVNGLETLIQNRQKAG